MLRGRRSRSAGRLRIAEQLLAVLSQPLGGPDAADAAQTRARLLDALSHAVGALVMSRACPDDSPLADEILAVSRDAILQTLGLA
jgi:TetR/AcrR family transcriptional repressor of nem operon